MRSQLPYIAGVAAATVAVGGAVMALTVVLWPNSSTIVDTTAGSTTTVAFSAANDPDDSGPSATEADDQVVAQAAALPVPSADADADNAPTPIDDDGMSATEGGAVTDDHGAMVGHGATDGHAGHDHGPSTVGDPAKAMAAFEPLRNDQDKFSRYAAVPSAELSLDALTDGGVRADNGSSPEGQFRIACEYSHFAYDDPIVFPGQPGRSHLHMFFGNTAVHAGTTDASLVNTGGGTCNGFELNRSGYWTPALLDGGGNIVVPDSIIVYYKSKRPDITQRMPQGLKMVSGNVSGAGFSAGQRLHWSCGGSGSAYNLTNVIPDCGGDTINATIQFPNCWDGRNLDSPDHATHMAWAAERQDCPSSHPVRLPQITFLLYFPGASSVDGWHLSSDMERGESTAPGASLHADWWGGWNDEAMDLWIEGCVQRARNCSFGQTGTSRSLARLNGSNSWEGDNYLPLPAGSYP
ncbi:MAG: DUF1996 domain-containing protein [Actinomycetota bacterium]